MSRSPSANGVHRRTNSRCGPPPSPNGAQKRSTPTPKPSPNGIPRNHLGQFAKGYAGGPGNPFARRVAALRRALLSVAGEAEMEALGRVLLKNALDGDTAAAKLFLAYAVGKPTPTPDPDGLDFDELRKYRLAIEAMPHLPSMIHALPPDVACLIVQATRPLIAADTAKQMVKELRKPTGQLTDEPDGL